ncbi:hypothetical protein [Brachyspira sp. SAP_772]|uniref:hypothetical protein n=1 Tax=Brachyspira sp. SAP_772 TaxID=2608385 RepID=UPI0012F4D2E2|nr:hypothetical protein [Brachyspira sp. SAP_772]
MKVAKNLFSAFIFFIIFFCIYLFRYLENFSYGFNIDVLKNFFISNIFSILFISFLCSSIFIGVFNKKKNISNFITIIIFSIIALIYPTYIIFFNANFNDTEYSYKYIIKDSNYLYKVDNYLVKSNPTNDEYGSSILIDSTYSNKIYFADNMLITKNDIILNKVVEVNSNDVVNRDLVSLNRKNIYGYIVSVIEDIVFGFDMSSYLNRLLKYISVNDLSIFFICVSYAALFLLLLSVYMISSSLSFSKFVYHNLLLGFIIYIMFAAVFFFVRFKYSFLIDNYINFSIFLCVLSLIIIVLYLVINIFIRNNKRMEE